MNKDIVTAAVDLGSGSIRLKIVQQTEQGEISVLENVVRTVAVGRDTFSTGRISMEMADEICRVLLGFKKLMNEYKVRRRRIVATSALREAENADAVLELIRVRTGLTVDVLPRTEERYLTRQGALSAIPGFRKMTRDGLMYTRIGSGTTQIAAYDKSGLCFSQTTQLGTLRIHQMLASIEKETLRFQEILSEYITETIQPVLRHGKQQEYERYLISGAVCEAIYRIEENKSRKEPYAEFDFSRFEEMYERIINKSAVQIEKEYDLNTETAELILPSVMLIHTFGRLVGAKTLVFSFGGLLDGVLWELSAAKKNEKQRERSYEDLLAYTKVLADRFQCDRRHDDTVNDYAMELFDRLRKPRGYTDRHRILLQMAVLLHETGKFLNLTNYADNSAMLVQAFEFSGISWEERHMIATMIRLFENIELTPKDPAYEEFDRNERLVISGLSMIMRLADGLDYSRKQKFGHVGIQVSKNCLILTAETEQNAMLEQWRLSGFANQVQEILGLELELHIKGGM
ncbi:MAG: hypothetical protein II795_06730 [Firmicutes bacterium]|nr:hypothetical protein [Bacillota bacterium]